jgi:hypothetical protein
MMYAAAARAQSGPIVNYWCAPPESYVIRKLLLQQQGDALFLSDDNRILHDRTGLLQTLLDLTL